MRAASISISFVSSAATLSLVRRHHHLSRYLASTFASIQRQCQHSQLLLPPPPTSFVGNNKTHSFSNIRMMAMAASGENSEKFELPKSVPVRVAHELLQAGHHYLDVRTFEEFTAGHALGAVNIPYMFKAGDGMKKNPDFLEEVSKRFGKDDEIIVGCQSGKRSLMAATDLSSAGFTGVTDIAGGYSAWRQNGLPTE
ncbi:Rhodanese-related sulfurtransferase [Thalictrum thalictroides]|uniref:Rhodanese-related sulfurtransferase n=1 Tax=Thalictrum thalictroides TaxID=46969 RepID=A0A7J6UTM4_THATH|nr:Rhodanese-related sulfurtransferase [Thalictrum thalictroides]